MFGWFKKKYTKPPRAYASSDPQIAYRLLHVQAAHQILDAWEGKRGDLDALAHAAVVASIGELLKVLRKYFPPASKHIVEQNSLYARLFDMTRYRESFSLIDEFVANLKKANEIDDTSLVIFVTGAYAPSEVRKSFSHVMVNPPDGATPAHARAAFEMAMAASKTY